MELTPDNVTTVIEECTAGETATAETQEVEGIVRTFRFDAAAIEEHRLEISAMLNQLPLEFHENGGGGWSFLMACDRRDGVQWTGYHRVMEDLFALGIATGLVEWLLPRELWSNLPGEVPYIVVRSGSGPEAGAGAPDEGAAGLASAGVS